jgi:hypothetical protein
MTTLNLSTFSLCNGQCRTPHEKCDRGNTIDNDWSMLLSLSTTLATITLLSFLCFVTTNNLFLDHTLFFSLKFSKFLSIQLKLQQNVLFSRLQCFQLNNGCPTPGTPPIPISARPTHTSPSDEPRTNHLPPCYLTKTDNGNHEPSIITLCDDDKNTEISWWCHILHNDFSWPFRVW